MRHPDRAPAVRIAWSGRDGGREPRPRRRRRTSASPTSGRGRRRAASTSTATARATTAATARTSRTSTSTAPIRRPATTRSTSSLVDLHGADPPVKVRFGARLGSRTVGFDVDAVAGRRCEEDLRVRCSGRRSRRCSDVALLLARRDAHARRLGRRVPARRTPTLRGRPIVYLHGMWASPEDSCGFFERSATPFGFLVCPRGNAPLGDGKMWAGTYASVAPRLHAALDAAAAAHPGASTATARGR